MSAPIITKSYQVWIDRTPTAPTPDWVEVTFIKAEGELRANAIPYLEATVAVQMPASLASARYDPRNRTRVQLRVSTPAPSTLPWCYIKKATPIDADARIYELQIVSEDGRLLEPANPSADVVSWRHYLTLDTLIPTVLAQEQLGLSGSLPTSGVRCEPVYEKRNLLINPKAAPGYAPAEPDQVERWLGSNYGNAQTTPMFTRHVDGSIWFLSHDSYPSVTEGQTYTYSVQIQTSPGAVGQTVWINMRFYLPHPSGLGLYYIELGSNHVLKSGTHRYSTTQTVPHGADKVGVGGTVFAAPGGSFLVAEKAMLCEYDPGDPDGEYWDGGTASTEQYDYVWAGDPNKSVSLRLPLTPRSLEVALQEPGESLWSVIAPHMARLGWRLLPRYGEPDLWRVVATDSLAALDPGNAFHAHDPNSYLTLESVVDRDDADYADSVVLHYQWSGGRRGPQEHWDEAGVASPTKVLRFDLEEPYPGPGAASKYLTVAQRRGHRITVTAPLDLWWRAGDELISPTAFCLIDTLSFDTDTDVMTLTCTPTI